MNSHCTVYSTVELTRKCTASVDEQWSQATDTQVKVQTYSAWFVRFFLFGITFFKTMTVNKKTLPPWVAERCVIGVLTKVGTQERTTHLEQQGVNILLVRLLKPISVHQCSPKVKTEIKSDHSFLWIRSALLQGKRYIFRHWTVKALTVWYSVKWRYMKEKASEQQNESFRTALCIIIISFPSMDTMKKKKKEKKTNSCDVYRPVRGRRRNSPGSNPSVLHMLLGASRVQQKSRHLKRAPPGGSWARGCAPPRRNTSPWRLFRLESAEQQSKRFQKAALWQRPLSRVSGSRC